MRDDKGRFLGGGKKVKNWLPVSGGDIQVSKIESIGLLRKEAAGWNFPITMQSGKVLKSECCKDKEKAEELRESLLAL